MLTSDNELLGLYVNADSDQAFEQLILRHAPMVMGVCRSVLWQAEDIEDAFQAVFLLLSQKAPKLTQHNSVGGWLHETAFRTCLKLRKRISRVREVKMEHEPAQAHEPWQLISEARDCELLHKEIMRLPKRYRDVIVLCHLEGKSRSQAAAVLDCTTASVKAALARGRQLLRRRLIKHGIAASVAFGTLSLTQASFAAGASGAISGSGAINQNLIQSTVEICAASKAGAGVGTKAAYIQSLIQKEAIMNFNLASASLTTATCTLLICIICSLSMAVGANPSTRATIYLGNLETNETAPTKVSMNKQQDDEEQQEDENLADPRLDAVLPPVVRVGNVRNGNAQFSPLRQENEALPDYAERLYNHGVLSDDEFDQWLAGKSLDLQKSIEFTSHEKTEQRTRTVTIMKQVEKTSDDGTKYLVNEPQEVEQTYLEVVPTQVTKEFTIRIGNEDQAIADNDSGFEVLDDDEISDRWVFPSQKTKMASIAHLPIEEQISNWKTESTKKDTETWKQYVDRLHESGYITRAHRRKWMLGRSIKVQKTYNFAHHKTETRTQTLTVMQTVEETDEEGRTIQKAVPRQVERTFTVLIPKSATREGLFGIPTQGEKPDSASNPGFLFREK